LRSCRAFSTFFEAALEYLRAIVVPSGKYFAGGNRQGRLAVPGLVALIHPL
jgi:hypothetical protein